MKLLVFGYGYTSAAFMRRARTRFDEVVATVRSQAKAEALARDGVVARLFPETADEGALEHDIAGSDAILVSVPPGPVGDPVLARFADAIGRSPARWVGYLSTIGVYGDHDGRSVDETTPPSPVSARSRERLLAEDAWLRLGARSGRPVHVFRLAGIYGPGRGPFAKVLDGTAQRTVKPGQVFNRIHVDDIAAALEASLDRPRPGAIYNLSDTEPAPPQDVVTFACRLAGVAPPPPVPFEAAELSPMARSFYGENKRVRSRLIRDELGVRLAYPTYREGIRAIAAAEGIGSDREEQDQGRDRETADGARHPDEHRP